MNAAKLLYLACFFSTSFFVLKNVESKSLKSGIQNQFHSDVIVTHWPTPAPESKVVEKDSNDPGFMVSTF